MPALPAVPGAIKLELLWNQQGLPAANVMHLGYTGTPPGNPGLQTLCSDFATAFWTDDMKTDYSDQTTFVGCRATDLSSDTGAEGEHDISSTGEDGAEPMPAQCCILLNYQIARRYRGGHPRTYLPPASRTWQGTISTWNATLLTVVNTAWTTGMAAVIGEAYDDATITGPICVSYFSGGSPRVDPLVEPITGLIVSGLIRTQRRRLTASSY